MVCPFIVSEAREPFVKITAPIVSVTLPTYVTFTEIWEDDEDSTLYVSVKFRALPSLAPLSFTCIEE